MIEKELSVLALYLRNEVCNDAFAASLMPPEMSGLNWRRRAVSPSSGALIRRQSIKFARRKMVTMVGQNLNRGFLDGPSCDIDDRPIARGA